MNILKRANLDRRRTRWANARKTWATFFVTMAVLIFFAVLLGLFTWGVTAGFATLGI